MELSCVNKKSRFSRGNALRLGDSDCAIDEKRWTNEMVRVLVYSRVFKLKNVNKKGLCLQAKIATERFPRGKAFFFAPVDVEELTFRFYNSNV